MATDTTLNFILQAQNEATDAIDSTKDSLKELGDTTEGVSEQTDKGTTSFLKLSSAVAAGQMIAAVAEKAYSDIKTGITAVVTAANDNQAAMSQMQGVIQSTGDASGVTAIQQGNLADKISSITPTSKDAIMAGENMLSTFTAIKGSAFEGATTAANNMATFFNGGLAPSMQQVSNQALQIGKALNDPATGLAKLQREGVSFTASETAQIKAMSASGDIMGAQTVMLQELTNEFGNAGTAASTTFAGGLATVHNSLDEIKVDIGSAFEDQFAGVFQRLIPVINSIAPVILNIVPAVVQLADAIIGALPFVETIFIQLSKVITALLPAVSPIIGIIAQFAAIFATDLYPIVIALIPAFQPFASLLGVIARVIEDLMDALTPFINQGLTILVQMFKILLPPVEGIITALGSGLTSIMKSLQPVMPMIGQALQAIATAFADVLTALTPLIPVFANLIVQIIDQLVPFLPTLINNFTALMPSLVALLPPLVQIAVDLMPLLIDVLKFILPIVGQLTDDFNTLALNIDKFIIQALSDLIQWVTDVINFFKTFGPSILAGIAYFPTLLEQAGKDLIDGLITGLKGEASLAVDAVKGIGSTIVSGFKSLLGIHSPSTVFADIGMNLGQGLQQGIEGTKVGVQASVTQLAQVSLAGASSAAGNITSPSSAVISPLAANSTPSSSQTSSGPINITIAPQIGVYAGLPSEKRSIAVDLYNQVVLEARAHGIQLPTTGGSNIQ